MSWEERPLEKYVERCLSEALKSEGEELWARYRNTRADVVGQILPWIAANQPTLTDHGPKHVQDVIDNIALLLGFDNDFNEASSNRDACPLPPYEMLVLLLGAVMHDVGNILGRDRHNDKIVQLWNSLPAWNLWDAPERRLVIAAGRAHTGRGRDGSKDTLRELSITPSYFRKKPLDLASIAAIIRLADELAEGPQRTSNFMIENGFISDESMVFHQYAQITQVSIARQRGLIALSYNIDICQKNYPVGKEELTAHLGKLLEMAYSRALKLNYERQFARYYAPILSPFKDTSISLAFSRHGIPIDTCLKGLVLNDITSSSETFGSIEQIDSTYSIPNIVGQVLEVVHE